MNGLSLFANVGIAETYLHQEGIDIVVANELLPERARFYQHLYPDCNMICGDITSKETYNQIIAAAKEKNVEFIISRLGSPKDIFDTPSDVFAPRFSRNARPLKPQSTPIKLSPEFAAV